MHTVNLQKIDRSLLGSVCMQQVNPTSTDIVWMFDLLHEHA